MPATVGKIPGGEALVGGNLAASTDWNSALGSRIGLVFVFVMGVTFLLMLVAFGSMVIASTAMALNLLSVGAAYGVLSAVFVHGWGASLVGTQAPGAIESWIPLFVFVVLFGLSMDYNVFVVSRIREAHDRGMPTRQAVAHGIRSTAGVVTSAAIIMVAVFAVFGTLTCSSSSSSAWAWRWRSCSTRRSIRGRTAAVGDGAARRPQLVPAPLALPATTTRPEPAAWRRRACRPDQAARPATPLPTPAGHA